MLIKIKSCKATNYWYQDKIGKIFDCDEYNEELNAYVFSICYRTYWIDKDDAELVDIFYENILSDIKEKLTIISKNLQAYHGGKKQ